MDNNNDTTTVNTSPKKISLGLVLGWVFGLMFGLAGLVSIFSETVTGILMLILGAVLLPPTYKIILEKFNLSVSKGLKIVLVILLLIGIGASTPSSSPESKELTDKDSNSVPATNNQNNSAESTEVSQSQDNQSESPGETAQAVSESTPIPPPVVNEASNVTVSQRNAVRKAQSYLNFSGFSRTGLIAQLEFDQFSNADAIYGADNASADWSEQAAKKAESYMQFSAFSRGSLIEQLKFDGFTQAQAEYGADMVGL